MRVDAFDFDLPEELIALRPIRPRDGARLLVIGDEEGASGALRHEHVSDLPTHLRPGDVLVVNQTKVIPARLRGLRRREGSEAQIELTLHKRLGLDSWVAFARPAKRLKPGDIVSFDGFSGTVLSREAGEVCLQFSCGGADLDAAIAAAGELPLPPYIASKRAVDDRDEADYQTVFGTIPGAVAAPTAGLHFTPSLLAQLEKKGVGLATVTLHVGAGTFLPVSVDETRDHKMHAEWGEISPETAARLADVRAKGGRIVAVGTTALRLLEAAATPEKPFAPWRGETDIFITPGYRFRAVDLLLTNFHLPRSTLFMLVSAFHGLDGMRGAYRSAIAHKYRFYSYGDACLIYPGRAGEGVS